MKTKLFELFYKMKYIKQRNYLMGLLQLFPVKRRRYGIYETAADSRRQWTIAFSVTDGNGAIVRVCKQTFM